MSQKVSQQSDRDILPFGWLLSSFFSSCVELKQFQRHQQLTLKVRWRHQEDGGSLYAKQFIGYIMDDDDVDGSGKMGGHTTITQSYDERGL